MLKTLNKSIKDHFILEMIYMSKHEKLTKRRIKAYKASEDSFIAYCYFRRSIRTFKFANVLALIPVSRKDFNRKRSLAKKELLH